jgi:hypothetical protein
MNQIQRNTVLEDIDESGRDEFDFVEKREL